MTVLLNEAVYVHVHLHYIISSPPALRWHRSVFADSAGHMLYLLSSLQRSQSLWLAGTHHLHFLGESHPQHTHEAVLESTQQPRPQSAS